MTKLPDPIKLALTVPLVSLVKSTLLEIVPFWIVPLPKVNELVKVLFPRSKRAPLLVTPPVPRAFELLAIRVPLVAKVPPL